MSASYSQTPDNIAYTEQVLQPHLTQLASDFTTRFDELIRDLSCLSSDFLEIRADISSVQRDIISLRTDFSLVRSEVTAIKPTISSSVGVEPAVVSDLRFSGDARTIDSFLISVYDVLEANMSSFASDSRKISWVARHFVSGSPAHDWWVSQLQENARTFSREHPHAPRLAGTYSVAGVPFSIPVLVDISIFLRTVAKLFSDPYASQTALRDFQSLTMGKLSVIQFNAKFTALAFCIEASEFILMDYYRKALLPAVFQQALSRPDWAPCSTLAELMNVAILAAHQEEAIALAHRQRQPQHQPHHSNTFAGVSIPPEPTAMDISAINSNRSHPPASNLPATRFPFGFYRELCQARGVCWRCQKSFDDIHRSNKAAGKPICPNTAVSASDMDAFCVSCTSTSPSSTPSPLNPIQSIASASASSIPLSLPAHTSPAVTTAMPTTFSSHNHLYPPPPLPHLCIITPLIFTHHPLSPHMYPVRPLVYLLSLPLPLQLLCLQKQQPATHLPSLKFFPNIKAWTKPCFYDLPSSVESGSTHFISSLSFTGSRTSDPCLILRVMLGLGKKIVHACALIDPGSTGDFLNSRFASLHPFTQTPRCIPLTCTSFDGTPSAGGLVTHCWTGRLSMLAANDQLFDSEVTLDITTLGDYDLILGMPWLR